ncbi:MAG TPA: PKD domain-containing protein, partial [Chryseobacterium sp.]
FVRYSMKFNEDFHKVNTRSRTAIIFDKNEPIITNYATTRFLPGISIGVKAGYNFYPNLDNSTSYFVGATISPFKSYRFYWQAEWVNSLNKYDGSVNVVDETITNANGVKQRQRTTTSTENKSVNWEVPVLIRYNINNYIGIGAGFQTNINVSQEQNQSRRIDLFEGDSDKLIISTRTESNSAKNSLTNLKTGLLFDLTAGFARIGPSLGARYVINFEQNFNYFQFYGIWKF